LSPSPAISSSFDRTIHITARVIALVDTYATNFGEFLKIAKIG
jgi:hypothetical protein